MVRDTDECEYAHDHRWNACGRMRCLVCDAPLGPNLRHLTPAVTMRKMADEIIRDYSGALDALGNFTSASGR